MSNDNLPVTSREYKLMLNTTRFGRREADSEAFMALVKFLIGKEGGTFVPQEEVDADQLDEKKRRTFYLDTPEMGFRDHGFILRVRQKTKLELNLKYRGRDRYVAAARDVSTVPPAGAKLEGEKFEEDVLPPFVGQFSRSATVEKVDAGQDLSTVERITAIFPGLRALEIPGDTTVEVANQFVAAEVVRRSGGIRFEGSTELIKMSLSFWYLEEEAEGFPMVGEFSFDYDAVPGAAGALEEFPLVLVEGAERVFRALQLQSGWLDLEGTTKSAFAVSGL